MGSDLESAASAFECRIAQIPRVASMTQFSDGGVERESQTNGGGRAEILFEPRRVVLFVAVAGTVSDRLIRALEREFPWVVVEQTDSVGAACAAFDHPVSLILVDPPLMKAVEQASSELTRLHPQALTAVIERDDFNPACSFPEILGFQFVRGVLPMNLRLDVWLSVIRLMLCGGEYFPPGMYHSYARRVGDTRAFQSGHGVTPAVRNGSSSQIAELTAREIQILEMVSRGLQNKTIAAEFRLSEHTVKIHLHNIISKLGAHNRTEAAAKFRHFQEHNLSLVSRYWPAS
jgi:DNA-binding NarL/FixJ family response regulator